MASVRIRYIKYQIFIKYQMRIAPQRGKYMLSYHSLHFLYFFNNTSISLRVYDWMLIKLNNSIPQVSIFQNIIHIFL